MKYFPFNKKTAFDKNGSFNLMKIIPLKSSLYKKDGSLDYEKASKLLGLTPSDLHFYLNDKSSLLDPTELLSGVFVGYQPLSESPIFMPYWMNQTCYHSKDDLRHIRHLLDGPEPKWNNYNFFVMSSSGKILCKNFDLNVSVDENGIFHLTSNDTKLNQLVYPASRTKYPYKKFFCYGKDFDELNKHIAMMISSKRISVPKNFKNGFSKTSEYPLTNGYGYEKQ